MTKYEYNMQDIEATNHSIEANIINKKILKKVLETWPDDKTIGIAVTTAEEGKRFAIDFTPKFREHVFKIAMEIEKEMTN